MTNSYSQTHFSKSIWPDTLHKCMYVCAGVTHFSLVREQITNPSVSHFKLAQIKVTWHCPNAFCYYYSSYKHTRNYSCFFFYSLWFLSCFPKYPLILQISFLFLCKRRLQPFFKLKQIWYKGANQIVCSSDLFLSFFCLVLILKLYFHCRFVFKCYGYFFKFGLVLHKIARVCTQWESNSLR